MKYYKKLNENNELLGLFSSTTEPKRMTGLVELTKEEYEKELDKILNTD